MRSFTQTLKAKSAKVFFPVTPVKVLGLVGFPAGAAVLVGLNRGWLSVLAGVAGLVIGAGYTYVVERTAAETAARQKSAQVDLLTRFDQWAQAKRAEGKEPTAEDYLGRQ